MYALAEQAAKGDGKAQAQLLEQWIDEGAFLFHRSVRDHARHASWLRLIMERSWRAQTILFMGVVSGYWPQSSLSEVESTKFEQDVLPKIKPKWLRYGLEGSVASFRNQRATALDFYKIADASPASPAGLNYVTKGGWVRHALGLLYETGIVDSSAVNADALSSSSSSSDGHASVHASNNDPSMRILLEMDKTKARDYFVSSPITYAPNQVKKGMWEESVNGNKEQAFLWYKRAAEQEDAIAQFYMGLCYRDGVGVAVDVKQQIYWYQLAAGQALADAEHNLAMIYRHGAMAAGMPVDYHKMKHYYQRAADRGFVKSFADLGVLHVDGLCGYVKNETLGVQYLERATSLGNLEAENALGAYYLDVAKDKSRAFACFHHAATHGYRRAQFNLARHYEAGDVPNIPKDMKMAFHWYNRLAKHTQSQTRTSSSDDDPSDDGHFRAKEWLETRLENSDCDPLLDECVKLLENQIRRCTPTWSTTTPHYASPEEQWTEWELAMSLRAENNRFASPGVKRPTGKHKRYVIHANDDNVNRSHDNEDPVTTRKKQKRDDAAANDLQQKKQEDNTTTRIKQEEHYHVPTLVNNNNNNEDHHSGKVVAAKDVFLRNKLCHVLYYVARYLQDTKGISARQKFLFLDQHDQIVKRMGTTSPYTVKNLLSDMFRLAWCVQPTHASLAHHWSPTNLLAFQPPDFPEEFFPHEEQYAWAVPILWPRAHIPPSLALTALFQRKVLVVLPLPGFAATHIYIQTPLAHFYHDCNHLHIISDAYTFTDKIFERAWMAKLKQLYEESKSWFIKSGGKGKEPPVLDKKLHIGTWFLFMWDICYIYQPWPINDAKVQQSWLTKTSSELAKSWLQPFQAQTRDGFETEQRLNFRAFFVTRFRKSFLSSEFGDRITAVNVWRTPDATTIEFKDSKTGDFVKFDLIMSEKAAYQDSSIANHVCTFDKLSYSRRGLFVAQNGCEIASEEQSFYAQFGGPYDVLHWLNRLDSIHDLKRKHQNRFRSVIHEWQLALNTFVDDTIRSCP